MYSCTYEADILLLLMPYFAYSNYYPLTCALLYQPLRACAIRTAVVVGVGTTISVTAGAETHDIYPSLLRMTNYARSVKHGDRDMSMTPRDSTSTFVPLMSSLSRSDTWSQICMTRR